MKKKYVIGVDVGASNIKVVLFGEGKNLLDSTLPTPKDDKEHFLTILKALVNPLLNEAEKKEAEVIGLGFGLSGPVNREQKRILKSPNNRLLETFNLAEEVESIFELPVKMDNDANCFLRAEVLVGAGQKLKNVYGLTLGTGVGGAWWVDNDIYSGARGLGNEASHNIFDFSSQESLEQIYQKIISSGASNLAEQAYRGDKKAQASFKDMAKLIGGAAAGFVNLLDVEAVIIGGGILNFSDLFWKKLEKTAREYIFVEEAKKTKILKNKLGPESGAVGAALLFKEEIKI